MTLNKKSLTLKLEHVSENGEMSLLDLPELALECILQKLSPKALCRMTCVCILLKEKCGSDHLWANHMQQKWGRIIGETAYREWKLWHIALKTDLGNCNEKEAVRLLSFGWPASWGLRKKLLDDSSLMQTTSSSRMPVNSIMALYLALETGRFWFPAQNGGYGFALSCYDAEVRYVPRTNTFQARFPPHGRSVIVTSENGVPWVRLRAPPVNTGPYDLHISDSLNELCPGDKVEVQWRIMKTIPYGWWYGVIGHLETCDRNPSYCICHDNDKVIIEFKQYHRTSQWRRGIINRIKYGEQGDKVHGFYGGIIKLQTEEQISPWKRIWPEQFLD